MVPAPPAALRGWRALLLALVVGACWLAFDPQPPAVADTGHDKLQHAFAFAVLTACAARAFPSWSALRLFGAALCLGGFIEVVQLFVPGRSAEFADLAADAAGALLTVALLRWRRRAPKTG